MSYIIDIAKLKANQTTFNEEANHFNRTTLTTFSSSFINTSSDPHIRRMANLLNQDYQAIQSAYESINEWWRLYNQNAEGLESELANK